MNICTGVFFVCLTATSSHWTGSARLPDTLAGRWYHKSPSENGGVGSFPSGGVHLLHDYRPFEGSEMLHQSYSQSLFCTFSGFFWIFWLTTFNVVRKFPRKRTRNVSASMNTWKERTPLLIHPNYGSISAVWIFLAFWKYLPCSPAALIPTSIHHMVHTFNIQ